MIQSGNLLVNHLSSKLYSLMLEVPAIASIMTLFLFLCTSACGCMIWSLLERFRFEIRLLMKILSQNRITQHPVQLADHIQHQRRTRIQHSPLRVRCLLLPDISAPPLGITL